jgi:hypothetical protein
MNSIKEGLALRYAVGCAVSRYAIMWIRDVAHGSYIDLCVGFWSCRYRKLCFSCDSALRSTIGGRAPYDNCRIYVFMVSV